MQVLAPVGLEKFEIGQQVSINWRSLGLTSTVDIDLLQQGNPTPVVSIAQGASDTGSFSWTIPNSVPLGSHYRIRVTIARPDGLVADLFQIVSAGTDYYVNDASTDGDVFTTAAGNNANDGKSPATPMASLAALLAAYDLDPGDTIHVDTGTYALAGNIVITAQDSGVTITGPDSATALLNRGTSSGYVFELQNADDVTLENLSITGANQGIYASASSDSDRLILRRLNVFNNANWGIELDASNDQATIEDNTDLRQSPGHLLWRAPTP